MDFRRLNYYKVRPEAVRAMRGLGQLQAQGAIEHSLLELVKTRASQINHCGFCLDMHTRDARRAGETEQRLYGLSTWRDAPFYTDRERAALAWTEAVTLVGRGVPDAVFEEARRQFTEKELADLTWAVVTINAWNRIAISFRAVPETYKPHMRAQLEAQLTGSAARN